MDPLVTSSLISGGASLLGGLFGSSGPSKFEKQMSRAQFQFQQDLAKQGIRWRVEDARAAGLHPLSVLGIQPQGGAPVQIPAGGPDPMGQALADAGQHVGRAVAATLSKEEKLMRALQLQQAVANLEESDARKQVLLSEAARNRQEAMYSGPLQPVVPDVTRISHFDSLGVPGGVKRTWPGAGQFMVESAEAPTGIVEVVPPVVPVSNATKDAIAGEPQMWRAYAMPGLGRVYLPAETQGEAGQILSEMGESWPIMWMVYKENVARQGSEWSRRFAERYAPFGRLEQVKREAMERWQRNNPRAYRRRVDLELRK